MGTPTIKDIARILGLSVSTVSRGLAGKDRIPEATRRRIADTAREIGYVPNRAAQSLVGGLGSGFAGLILTDPGYGREDSYLGEYISGLGQGLSESGVDLFLAAIPEGQSELSVIRNIITSRRADGLILGRTTETDPRIDYLMQAGFPFVSHGRTADPAAGFDWIDTDGDAAFAEAFDLLYGLGHRHFALLGIDEPMTFRLHRTRGLQQAIAARGDPGVRLRLVSTPRYDARRRRGTVQEMLAGEDRPTAILTLFDSLALNVLEEAERLSLSVPDDLSVIGFDNIASAATARPGLTTFDSDTYASARDCARMLVKRIRDPGAPQVTRLVQPRLIRRASHGPAPKTTETQGR